MKKYLCTKALCIFFTLAATGQSDTTKLFYPNYWSASREYIYSAIYTDSNGHIITNEVLSIHPTEKVWEYDSKQTLAEFNLDYSPFDSARLAPFPLNQINRSWSRHYKEGVMQNTNKVWMHPIRSNQYLLTELAPFPEVYFPLQAGKSWKSTLWIYEAFGSFEGTVESIYTISLQEVRIYDFGPLKCWKIVAVGTHDKLGENQATYYFNEEYGFTEMNYHFYNNQKIEFKLLSLRE